MNNPMSRPCLRSTVSPRRAKLDPAALGFPSGRRRTPGLRREEVAQRANISPTWYTWLEQGRGGAPSPEVLDRIARALMLTDGRADLTMVVYNPMSRADADKKRRRLPRTYQLLS